MRDRSADHPYSRRSFLQATMRSGAAAGLGLHAAPFFAATSSQGLHVGEGVVDTTPPTGIELAGFHRSPGNERLITGIRQPTAARALVLRLCDVQVALISLDIIGVSAKYAAEVHRSVSRETGIPAENVRICATHTHSMPAFRYLRQWGKLPEEYAGKTQQSIVQAVKLANADLAPAELYLGKSVAKGGNFNRTSGTWKTESQFDDQSDEDERWLDSTVHTLRFVRGEGKSDVLWYHFSAHPVCYTDGLAGPDWIGGVAQKVQESEKVTPGFLQGHAGDVNPGDGNPWIGDPVKTSDAVYAAVRRAVSSAESIAVKEIRSLTSKFEAPLDMARLRNELEAYRANPEKCNSGPWVDAPFAADWFETAKNWDFDPPVWPTPISALQLGPVGFLFHSTELYSYYGLAIRHASPFKDTLVVGYADDIIGYVTDPKAYDAGEYAAITVPKIVNIPPFTKSAGQDLASAAGRLLKRLV